MRTRDRMALNIAPLCLRLPLALIFLWAGLSKIITEIDVTPDQAIVLQAHGVTVPNAPPLPTESTNTDAPPDPSTEPQPASEDADDARPENTPTPPADPTSETPAAPLPDPEADPEPGSVPVDTPAENAPADSAPTPGAPPSLTTANNAPRIILVQNTDESQPTALKARSVYQLVLLMDQRANPPSLPDGSANTPTWPQALAKAPWPKTLAWCVALTEVFAGFFLLIGLVTRLSALALSGVMLGAIWLTTISTAIQSGDTFLGFLPNEPFLSFFWKDPFWQLLCLMSCLALFFAGPGTLALDRAIFAPSSADDWGDDDDEARDRSSFDRAP